MSSQYEHNTFSDSDIDDYHHHLLERKAYQEAEYGDPPLNADDRFYNDDDDAGRRSP
ncbi:hypothetical protein BG011_002090, partial [Mortierella polycephala]